ncbi:N-acetylneuraminate synthase family protein [Rhizobium sp. CFBP 8752]|uniref:N-acetylneuraminate synthase family protein n=1 Tax=Rhizobium sp. CFBP 8752 TaxID=2775301 RepID=UPI00177F0163|nr:N-acetylneuraminate synthase family protein [Rhizobium sp. CFBP 8752]MBD8665919.1 N-acetylneuraminate synthase family protein [Rhizobium sp. CFBP 8752]
MTDVFSKQINAIASTYSTDTIFILGKGPSADEIPAEVYAGSLVIGLNDAERIYPADITVFHADWVKKALQETGPKSRLYVTSSDFDGGSGAVVRVPHIALGQESSDLMMQRLLSDEVVIEDVLFISALQVARAIARIRGSRQRICMVGFDFRADLGRAQMGGKVYDNADLVTREVKIDTQENYLLNALYMLQNSELDLIHVGSRSYSRLTSSDLIEEFLPASPAASSNWKVEVVAEITTNHFGDRGRLERMVRAAAAAGANYVKVQKRNVESFYSKEQLAAVYKSPFGKTFGDYRRHLELSRDDFQFLDELCKRLHIRWFASVLDEDSYRFIMEFSPPLIKLPSTISEFTDYLSLVGSTHRGGIVLSTGMTDKRYEDWVLKTFANAPKLYLMQANSAYPTPPADCNVGVVRHYHRLSRDDLRIIPAYSSHDPGWFGSTMAVAAGALMVEKHVKLGNTDWAHFDAVALDITTSEFRDYVAKIREAEAIVGSEEKMIAPSEHHKYRRSSEQ